ncbi:hypothetical protein HYU14_05190 [Candidatus Woesearchaeota archaeon]|nr:hypothetical protein [Candidatus Woesearchaeota archaeon]
MEVNEQIIKAYFEEVHKYVVRTNLYFKKRGKKGGAGPADIDLVMIHPKKGKYGKNVIVTVKGWQGATIRRKDIQNRNTFEKKWKIFQKQELKAADKFFGKNNYKKILILPPIKINDKVYCKKRINKEYKTILMDFPDILFELMDYLSGNNPERKKLIGRSFDSEFLQTLRIILINMFCFNRTTIQINKNFIHWLGWKKDHNYVVDYSRNKLVLNNPTLKGEVTHTSN